METRPPPTPVASSRQPAEDDAGQHAIAPACPDCHAALARADRFVAALDRTAAGFTSPAMPQ
jgi:hypothetical protein